MSHTRVRKRWGNNPPRLKWSRCGWAGAAWSLDLGIGTAVTFHHENKRALFILLEFFLYLQQLFWMKWFTLRFKLVIPKQPIFHVTLRVYSVIPILTAIKADLFLMFSSLSLHPQLTTSSPSYSLCWWNSPAGLTVPLPSLISARQFSLLLSRCRHLSSCLRGKLASTVPGSLIYSGVGEEVGKPRSQEQERYYISFSVVFHWWGTAHSLLLLFFQFI